MSRLWALTSLLLLACTSPAPDGRRDTPASRGGVVDLSGFEMGCKADDDCTTVEVNKCACGCNNYAIAVSEQARFDAALAAIDCPKEDPESTPVCAECIRFVPRCVEGTCKAVQPPREPRPELETETRGNPFRPNLPEDLTPSRALAGSC